MELKKFVLIPFSQYKSQLASAKPASTVLYDSKLTNEEKTKILPNLDRKKKQQRFVPSFPNTPTAAVESSSSSVNKVDRQKEAILLDVGGSETTQRRSASLYDKVLANPNIELTKEGTIKLENIDTDIPFSTFLYRLQTPFPKSSPVTRDFLEIVKRVKIPEHLIANKALVKTTRRQLQSTTTTTEGDDEDDHFESVDDEQDTSKTPTATQRKEWYSRKGEKKEFF